MDWDTAWREINAELAQLDAAIARWEGRLRRVDAWPRPLAAPARRVCNLALRDCRDQRRASHIALVIIADGEARGLA